MYKVSNYNCLVPYNSGMLYFNTITQSSFVLSHKEHQNIQKQLADPISFDLEFPSIFKQFKDWGFVVEDGLDEISGFRFNYMNEIINNHDYHLTIRIENLIDLDFVDSMNNHLNYMFEEEKIVSLNIEWIITEECKVEPIAEIKQILHTARSLSNQRSVKFTNQLRANSGLIAEHYWELINEFNIDDISFQLKLQEFIKSTTESDSNIKNLCRNLDLLTDTSVACDVHLSIFYEDKCSVELLGSILGQINEKIRPDIKTRIIVSSDLIKSKDNNKILTTKIEQLGFKLDSSNIKLKYLRVYQNTITTLKGVRLWPESCELDNCGVLQQDGHILWNTAKRNSLLGRIWFDNNTCAKCKYLPIMFAACSQHLKYNGNVIDVICPLAEKTIRTESIIVEIHEAAPKQK